MLKRGDIEFMEQNFKIFLEGVKNTYPKLKVEQAEVTETHILEIEEKMEIQFNDELKKWFQLIGNAKYGVDGFLSGMEIYSVDEMFEEWKSWREFDNDKILNDAQYYSSKPEGAIKCRYTNPKWIPLGHDYASNYIGVDLDPDMNGIIGQVINFGRDENDKKVFANSIKEYLELLIRNQDEMMISEEDNGDYYINEDGIHAIDWLKKKSTN